MLNGHPKPTYVFYNHQRYTLPDKPRVFSHCTGGKMSQLFADRGQLSVIN